MTGRVGLTSGSRLGAYEIQSPLGAGGMGEVYRATDTKLGRDVAVKVLPAEMAHDAERLARFRREAKALAQLDHPNIVTIYSVEESEGVHFLTMQLVDGQTLDHLIPQEGFPIEQILDIGIALADALAAAHEKGIVHRDLKPANVMVTGEGRVKVLDFGLAKDVSSGAGKDTTVTSAGHTEAGIVMGTPAYMSPEQVSGRALDHRTDLFSLGVMLHEMAAGQRPFEGGSSAELFSSILRDAPLAVTEVRADLPGDLARVIRRCLEKDPRRRMQTARDVGNEFRDMARAGARSTPAAKPSGSVTAAVESGAAQAEGFWVAVLPFKYSGGNADLVALAEGLAEEIITGLSRFSYLRVIARGSTARYAGRPVDIRGAGKELNARYVMEGTLRQAGGRLRLAVQLVDTVSGAHLWAENYERPFSPEALFDLQDDLVPRIVSTVADMNGVLPRGMSQVLRSRPPEQLSPYEAVLRSFAYYERHTPEELTAARAGLERAVRDAPAYSDAWAMLSLLCWNDYVQGFDLHANAFEMAASAARRAVECGPSNHLAYFGLALSLWAQKDFNSFRDAAERAVALNPMDGNSVAILGEYLIYAGSAERGMQLAARAKQLNPNHPGVYWYADFYNAYSQDDYRGALAFALKAKLRGDPLAPMFIATACGQLGDLDGGAKAVADLIKFRPELPSILRKQVAKVWNAEYGERFLDGLRKAGLEVPEAGQAPASLPGTIPARKGSGESRADEGFWVAVLPFKCTGGKQDLVALAEGLTDAIVTNMSRFSYLRVVARSSTALYAQRTVNIATAARELGARYLMEGSVRQAGTKVRIAVQLVDANTGTSLWAETYDRPFTPEAMLDLLDDVAPRIVAIVGETQGILAHSMTEALRNRDPESLTPYEALLRSFGFHQHVNAAEHLAGRTALERAVQEAPDRADCWAMLSWLYRSEHTNGYNARPDPMDRSLAAAQRAVSLAPSSYLAQAALASAFFFRHELGSFRPAAERALALNSMEGYITAFLGLHFAYAGDWDKGCALAERAIELNPNHPGWYWLPLAMNAYRQRDGRRALEYALKINMPGLWTAQVALTAIYSQLGNVEQASKALRDLLRIRSDFAAIANEELGKWWLPDLVETMLADLRKAGLDAPETVASAAKTASGETRADEGFWVAVLPFRYKGADQALHALADGLTDEIVTGLSRFSYLRVIARGSTAKYSSESGDVRAIGQELGARYVMEGSIRQAGSNCRIAVQVVDAVTGAHLWAETFDRPFKPDEIFRLQDELVPRIVSTVADAYGVLPHSMSQAVRGKPIEELTPYECVLRSFSYAERVSAEEYTLAKSALERAVEQAPTASDCWAMLSTLLTDGYIHGFEPEPDLLDRALGAARRAVDTGLSNHKAHQALAWALFFRKDYKASRTAAERTLALNPMDACATVYMGQTIALGGDWERGCSLILRAMDLNPNHPGWYWYCPFLDAYRKSDYRAALDIALRINMPDFPLASVALTATYAQLGELDAARSALRELLAVRPDYPAVAQMELERIMEPQLAAHLADGLRKAGLTTTAERHRTSASKTTSVPDSPQSGDDAFWVAVAPFKSVGAGDELAGLADGLSEEIVAGLSRFSYLRVLTKGTAGARYILEGNLRQAAAQLRAAVKLIDTTTGANLWAENYTRPYAADKIFEIQDDLAPTIVSTIADMHGVLPRSMGQALRSRKPEDLTPYEAVLRSFSYMEIVTPEELTAARTGLLRAVEKAPGYADALAMLSHLNCQDYGQGFDLVVDALQAGTSAARRAVELAATSHLAWFALAQALFFQRETESFRNAAERAVALNPQDGDTLAFMGELLLYAANSERGLELSALAKRLKPNHPGWYWYADWFDAYQRGDYQAASSVLGKIQLPGHWAYHAGVAATRAWLDDRDAAARAVVRLIEIRPNIAREVGPVMRRWWRDQHVEHYLEGLSKAGLFDRDPASESQTAAANTDSGAMRVQEGFWVAVLPFRASSPDVRPLADGMFEEIIAGLSHFSYLRVVARGSTLRYAGQSPDLRTAGRELGARYVMDGSLRLGGTRLRATIGITDTETGGQLWAETYERPFDAESIFEIQDDLVPRIVSTCADPFGVLPGSIGDAIRGTDPSQWSPYEALAFYFRYNQRLSPSDHLQARHGLEHAVEIAPRNADCWALLSLVYAHEYGHGFNPLPNPLERALTAAKRAVDMAPANYLPHQALSTVLLFRREIVACLQEADRAIELNPLDGGTNANLGANIAFAGDWERGCAIIERSMNLNPRHPVWYRGMLGFREYWKRNYRGAVELAIKTNAPDVFWIQILLAAAHGQLGEQGQAAVALRAVNAQVAGFAARATAVLGTWFLPDMVEHLSEGLRKTGMGTGDGAELGRAQPSIAVLPFANLSADPEQDYFSDGLAEEIISLLARVPGLKVIARTSAFAFRGKEQDIRSIAEALGVSTVLEGSVRRSGSRVRVTAQLIAASDGSHLWSERYDRELSDIFAVQDEISTAIAKALRVKLAREATPQRYTPKIEAYEAYLKGRHMHAKVTPESLELARRCYEQAIELDAAFGMAHVGIGYYWLIQAHFGRRSTRECVPAARAEAQRALRIDPSLADAHALLGLLAAMSDFDWAAAEKHFEFPLAKQASFELTKPLYSGFLFLRGDVEQAIQLAQRAIEEDPLEVWTRMNLHAYLQAAGRDAEAMEQLQKVMELDPNNVVALVSMAMIYADQGDMREALKIARRAYAVGPWFPDTIGVLAALLRRSGEEVESKSVANELGSGETQGDARAHAVFHLLCGEIDQGADWAEKAIEERDPSMMYYLRFVVSKGLRGSHRWAKIARLIKLEA